MTFVNLLFYVNYKIKCTDRLTVLHTVSWTCSAERRLVCYLAVV